MTVQAPVWSSQEMVDLLEAMARSADRNTLSFTETANIARSAADVIRYLAFELRNAEPTGRGDLAGCLHPHTCPKLKQCYSLGLCNHKGEL